MNPSKIAQRELRTRAYITYYLNSRRLDSFSDPKLKNWKRKVESRLTAYINGETSAKDIIHPSKYTGLSQEALKHKLQKSKMLQSHRNTYLRRESTIDWINLGKLLDSRKTEIPIKESEVKTEASTPEPPSQDKNATLREDPKNTVVFNGNVNILCLNVNSGKQPDSEAGARRLCEDLNRELKMLTSGDFSSEAQVSDLQLFRGAAEPIAAYEGANSWINGDSNTNVNQLTQMVNELLPAVQKLRRQHTQLLSDCRELMMERKILLKHQEITDKTINLLHEETNELREKNQFLVRSSENTIGKLNEQNRRLAEKLRKKEIEDGELDKRNRFLAQKLREEDAENRRLTALINSFRGRSEEKFRKIEECFNAIVDCIVRTENEIQELRNSVHSVDKRMLLNTIRKLDEQNSNLMGKVKHIPEKIKNILNHVSCTMSTLEEQNIRLLRTLQNTEIENIFENRLLKRIKD